MFGLQKKRYASDPCPQPEFTPGLPSAFVRIQVNVLYTLHLYLGFFSLKNSESSLSPSLPLSQRLFCISHTRKIFLIVEKETCGFSLISYDNSGSGERFSLCPRFGIWFAESGLNPRSSDLETHTVFTLLQMLLEIQNLKGYLLPYSILPQTPYTKSGISESVINMKVNLRDVNCYVIQWLLPEQGRGSELCLWFFISWDFKSVSCPFTFLISYFH